MLEEHTREHVANIVAAGCFVNCKRLRKDNLARGDLLCEFNPLNQRLHIREIIVAISAE